jgi:enamine deaminase RidA (YjgF/YER057c/UK114 family)
MSIDERLAALEIRLPESIKPVGSYVAVRIEGGLAFVSGMIPMVDGLLVQRGRVGAEVTTETACELARICAINALGALKAALGDLGRIRGVVMVQGFVQCVQEYHDVPKVINGASDLLVAVFGDAGRHARFAVGVLSLPMDAPVEIAFTVAIVP